MDLTSFLPEFARRLFNTSSGQAARDVIDSEELLSRFLTDKRHFKPGRPGHKAFEPQFDQLRQRSETSVFRTTALEEPLVWAIAAAEVEPGRGKRVIARAEIRARDVTIETLSVVADVPPNRHAVIIGWPEGDSSKDHRKALQLELAARARLQSRTKAAPTNNMYTET